MDVLIVSRQFDPATDFVLLALERLGERVIRLNTEDFGTNTISTFRMGASGWSGRTEILTSDREIDMARVKSVWWRRPQRLKVPDGLSPQETLFAQIELDHAFNGIFATLTAYWMSHPTALRASRFKMEQLQRAQQLGFEVPRTLVTSDPQAALTFWNDLSGNVIYKTLSTPSLAAESLPGVTPSNLPRMTLTTRVTREAIETIETVRVVPCLFQEYVTKLFEYRVTIVGDDVVAIEIDSQTEEAGALDWRRGSMASMRMARLPIAVSERCLAFVKSYGLNYSAIDLVLTPDGRYVFLENNPNGQFHFIDQAVPEARLTALIAARLAEARN